MGESDRHPTAPVRIQLRRTKGWRMPTGAVKVDRSTIFGNPFPLDEYGRDGALQLFARLLDSDDRTYARQRDGSQREYPPDPVLLAALAGRDLACWCRPEADCHADLLIAHVEALGAGDQG